MRIFYLSPDTLGDAMHLTNTQFEITELLNKNGPMRKKDLETTLGYTSDYLSGQVSEALQGLYLNKLITTAWAMDGEQLPIRIVAGT